MSQLTRESALIAHERVADRFSSVMRSAPQGTQRVPNLDWTVGETGAHVLGALRLYPEMLIGTATGWPSLRAGTEENARLLNETPEREPHEIAPAIDVAAANFRRVASSYADDSANWHAGLRIPLAAMVGLQMGDMLVHGWDVAHALGTPWVIDRDDACIAFASVIPVVSNAVNDEAAKGFSATYGISLRHGPAFAFSFDSGLLHASEGRPAKADCRMSVDPVAFLLTSYGRVPVWRPALTGQLVSYGRRPWLGLKLTSLLESV